MTNKNGINNCYDLNQSGISIIKWKINKRKGNKEIVGKKLDDKPITTEITSIKFMNDDETNPRTAGL